MGSTIVLRLRRTPRLAAFSLPQPIENPRHARTSPPVGDWEIGKPDEGICDDSQHYFGGGGFEPTGDLRRRQFSSSTGYSPASTVSNFQRFHSTRVRNVH